VLPIRIPEEYGWKDENKGQENDTVVGYGGKNTASKQQSHQRENKGASHQTNGQVSPRRMEGMGVMDFIKQAVDEIDHDFPPWGRRKALFFFFRIRFVIIIFPIGRGIESISSRNQ